MKDSTTRAKHVLTSLAVAAFWLLVWQILSLIVGEELILSSPISVFKKLIEMLGEASFWRALLGSFWRITLGFLLAVLGGVLLALLSYAALPFKTLFYPLASVMKATPVVSFIVLALILFGSANVSTPISFVMVLPIIYTNTLAGFENTEKEVLEMAAVFHVPFGRKLRYVILPSVMPFFITGSAVAIGMCWKSGVAAEVIGLAKDSLGRKIYDAKIFLNTSELFAYTLVIILVSVAFERLFLRLMRAALRRIEQGGAGEMRNGASPPHPGEGSKKAGTAKNTDVIRFDDLTFAYRQSGLSAAAPRQVFSHFDAAIQKGRATFLFGPSGSGKTTLLRLLLALNTPSGGTVEGLEHDTAAVFQEDRLLGHLSAVANVALVLPQDFPRDEIIRQLLAVGLDEGDLEKPVAEFSGGMKRRVAIVRAVATGWPAIVMDEPFKGLDDATKTQVVGYIRCETAGRTLVVVSHDESDAALFAADVLRIEALYGR